MQLNTLVARGRMIAAGRMLGSLDQKQLVAEAGLAPSTVSKIENGRHGVHATTLQAVQDVLGHLDVDVTQKGRTRDHAVGTSYA